MKIITVIYILVLLQTCKSYSFKQDSSFKVSIQEQINDIQNKLNKQRYNEEKEFRFWPPQFYQKKGLYSSNIHGNAIDKNNTFPFHLIRQFVGCPDSNMFVTNFILSALLDCAEFGTIKLDQDKFEESIDAILDFRDKNQKDGIPSYSFWQQDYKNGTWYSNPKNLQKVAETMKNMPDWVKQIFIKMGLSFVADADKIAGAFHLPPDTDDSSVNIALGIRLLNSPFIRQSIKDKWQKHNSNLEGYYSLLKKYSYKPFLQSNSSVNTIDIRTYFAFHEFINQQKSTNFSLFTTWIRSTDDQIQKVIEIPGNTNNFDCSVLSNNLYALHQVLLNSNATEVEKIFDNELQGLYLNTSNIIIYTINSYKAISHPDIAFLYYPSVYDFYWFVARNVHYLNSNQQKIPLDIIKQVADGLNISMKNQGTTFILNSAQANERGDIYWEEFLGVYHNKTYHEDTTFSTVMALNALIDTWTISKIDGKGKTKRFFVPETPKNVTNTIKNGIKTLSKRDSFSKSNENAFFSGSQKSLNTLYFYPMNIARFLNGTLFDPHTSDMYILDQVVGIKGIIEEDSYSEMLQQYWFKHKPYETFVGYNSEYLSFPYWSSPSITFSMGMSLLSKYQSLDQASFDD